MNKRTFYITTPIYYPSGNAHIGHGYCTVASDAIARYKRERGYDVMFLTGTDEHGQKIENKAKENGVAPKEYVDKIVAGFQDLWKLLNISHDRFIRTTDDYHEQAVSKIFTRLYEQGEIYKGKYEGWYCTPDEAFWTETQLADGKCPDCGREVIWAEEEAYFFKLSKYADRLLEYYAENPHFIQPESRKNEMISFIKNGLDDLCVSRTSFTWGIPVEFDTRHVIYVWLDALSNYITAMGYNSEHESDYQKYWPADVHFVGKEIVRFHTIIWPAMLMALNEPLPAQIYGHGWLLMGKDKISKSRGNVVDPVLLCNRYGVDSIRYFLLREIPFGSDGVFTNEALINRINADLANDLGNLLSRTTAMADKYFGGNIPSARKAEALDDELITLGISIKTKVESFMEEYQFSSALAEIWKLIVRSNKYIDETAPWILGKNPDDAPRLAAVLYNLAEALRVVSILLKPFLPETSSKMQAQIGAKEGNIEWECASEWDLLSGENIHKGESLFPRIDIAKEIAELDKLTAPPVQEEEPEVPVMPQITIDEFARSDIRVGKVTACERIKKAKKLLKLTIDDGTGIPRTIVSGIAKWYSPEDIVGHNVLFVANLKPVTLCGVESQGMVLCSETSEEDVRLIFADTHEVGAKIR